MTAILSAPAPAAPTEPQLEGFRAAQRLAYRCCEEVAATLWPGVTERAVARQMRRWLDAHGVADVFHQPFAWFGDRTAFAGFRVPLQFFPTGRRLGRDDPFILDVAPIVEGYTADVGHTGCLGENRLLGRLDELLAESRALVVDQVRAGRRLCDVYAEVDRLATAAGAENRHRAYPFHVIAHRVGIVPDEGPRLTVGRFGSRSLRGLAADLVAGRRGGWSPLWNGGRHSNHPATPGLWAVEPHFGIHGVGAKFEELLVVTDTDAFWLDDAVPHVERWSAAKVAARAADAAADDEAAAPGGPG